MELTAKKVTSGDEIKSEDHNALVEDTVTLAHAIESIPAPVITQEQYNTILQRLEVLEEPTT